MAPSTLLMATEPERGYSEIDMRPPVSCDIEIEREERRQKRRIKHKNLHK